MTRIVIADDHAIVREGLKRIVGEAADLEVVDEAADGTEVMRLVRERDFDVLVLDLSMPGRSGMELIKLVKAEKPRLRILVLSMHQELQYAVRAIKSGASGYLTKESAPAAAGAGHRARSPRAAPSSAPRLREQLALGAMPGAQPAAPHDSLSDREFEVFRLLVGGMSVTDIAARLKLSVKTVSTHKANLMQKMGLQNQTELVRYAIKHGLAEQDLVAQLPALGIFLASFRTIPRVRIQRTPMCAKAFGGHCIGMPYNVPVKVFLADDSALIRARVAVMLAAPAMTIVGRSRNARKPASTASWRPGPTLSCWTCSWKAARAWMSCAPSGRQTRTSPLSCSATTPGPAYRKRYLGAGARTLPRQIRRIRPAPAGSRAPRNARSTLIPSA